MPSSSSPLPRESDTEVIAEPQRPPQFATDKDWALDSLTQMWEMEDRLADAEAALEDIGRAIDTFRTEPDV